VKLDEKEQHTAASPLRVVDGAHFHGIRIDRGTFDREGVGGRLDPGAPSGSRVRSERLVTFCDDLVHLDRAGSTDRQASATDHDAATSDRAGTFLHLRTIAGNQRVVENDGVHEAEDASTQRIFRGGGDVVDDLGVDQRERSTLGPDAAAKVAEAVGDPQLRKRHVLVLDLYDWPPGRSDPAQRHVARESSSTFGAKRGRHGGASRR
jgi:hypothetical protein